MVEFSEEYMKECTRLIDNEIITAGGLLVNGDEWEQVQTTVPKDQLSKTVGWANVRANQIIALVDNDTNELVIDHPCIVLGISFKSDEDINDFTVFLAEGGPNNRPIMVRLLSDEPTGIQYVGEDDWIRKGPAACSLVSDIQVAEWVEGAGELISHHL